MSMPSDSFLDLIPYRLPDLFFLVGSILLLSFGSYTAYKTRRGIHLHRYSRSHEFDGSPAHIRLVKRAQGTRAGLLLLVGAVLLVHSLGNLTTMHTVVARCKVQEFHAEFPTKPSSWYDLTTTCGPMTYYPSIPSIADGKSYIMTYEASYSIFGSDSSILDSYTPTA